MKNLLMMFSVLLAACSLAGTGPRFAFEGMTECFAPDGENFVFDSSRAKDCGAFRYGVVRALNAYDGDVRVSATFEIGALDQWNGFWLGLMPANGGDWRAVAGRQNGAPGDSRLTFRAGEEASKVERATNAVCSAVVTLAIAREKERVSVEVFEKGAERRLKRFEEAYEGPLSVVMRFDSAAATRARVTLRDFQVRAGTTYASALSPSYGVEEDFGPCVYLGGSGGARGADGTLELRKGDRALFAIQAPVTVRDWSLRWKSSGRLAVRSIVLGSAESMQLSDNVVWDDVDAKIPEGFAPRGMGLGPWITRFASDVGWHYPYATTSGLHFFEVFPTTDETVRIGDVHLFGARALAPSPLAAPAKKVDSSALPLTLSPALPSVEIAIGTKAGAFEITHVAGRQPPSADPTLAGWLIVYEDGTTEPAFATLRWNCGVYRSEDLEFGPGQGGPDNTWWGPPGFAWGKALYDPKDSLGTLWNTRYLWTLLNPHPEKKVLALQAFLLIGDTRSYTVQSVRVRRPEETTVALVEPEEAAFEAGRPLTVRVYEYRACAAADGERAPLVLRKSEAAPSVPVATVAFRREGRLGAACATFTPRGDVRDCGAVTLVCGAAQSSRCSLMPRPAPGDKPCYYSMICGGHDGFGEFDRMRRVGYDSAKVHIGWQLDKDGHPDFSVWPERFDRIARAGLKIAVRNLFAVPKEYEEKVPKLRTWSPADGEGESGDWVRDDAANAFYVGKVTDYYRSFAALVAGNPNVIGINANYGCRTRVIVEGDEKRAMKLVWSAPRMAAFNDLRRAAGAPEVTPADVATDPKLLADYSRFMEGLNDRLIRRVCEAIRSAGYRGHLTFNVNFHPIENKMSGTSFGEYLRLGRDMGPGSLFHETSERYCVSFVKWLAAARTFGLPYGDECCQPPPTDEHAIFAYMWMGMMQCFEANYCQWWGGRPAPQNVAQLKAYHRLLFNADYISDPVCLAMSLQTGHDEISETVKHPLHTQTMSHYGLANCLRELNVNADRYMIDEFPELDGAVTSRLLIDDVVRAVPTNMADRIERFVRAGGVYLASSETDSVNGGAFFRRFGVADVKSLERKGKAVRYSEVPFGAGRLVIFHGTWAHGWELGRPDDMREEFLALLTRLGGFTPHVRSSVKNVAVTPYRAKDGAVLVSTINTACLEHDVRVGISKELFKRRPSVRDLGTGLDLKVVDDGRYWSVDTTVPAINTTVLRVCE